MYGRNRRRLPVSVLIIIAVIAGFIFYVRDNQSDSTDSTISLEPDAVVMLSTETPAAASPETDAPVTMQPTAIPISSQRLIPDNAEIFIPTAGIRTRVVEALLDGVSWDVSQLGNHAGHLQGTPWVGNGGNIVFSGHVERSTGEPGIFANLHEVKPGDLIIVMVDGNEWRYSVTEINSVQPDDLTPLSQQHDSERLTLITCGEYNFLQDSYLVRTVVVAERVS